MVQRVILTPPQDITFGSFMFDATVKEVFKAQSKITSYPVEVGAEITDHVTQPPRELSLTGVVTATPMDESEQRELRIQDLFRRLLVLQLKEEPLEVFTTFGYIPDMLIISVQATYEGAGDGDMMKLAVNLKTIKLSESKRVVIFQTRLEQERLAALARLEAEVNKKIIEAGIKQLEEFQVISAERKRIRKRLNRVIFNNPKVSDKEKWQYFITIKKDPKYKGVIRSNEYFHNDGLTGNPDFGT